jgi:hypothetical protein
MTARGGMELWNDDSLYPGVLNATSLDHEVALGKGKIFRGHPLLNPKIDILD